MSISLSLSPLPKNPLSLSFSDGSLRQIFASVSDLELPLLLFLHRLYLAQILWSWQDHARCCCSSKLQQRCLVFDQELRHSSAERAQQDRDVLVGLLRHLYCRRYSQLWSHSHGHRSSRSCQVQYAGPILLDPSLSSIFSFFFFDLILLYISLLGLDLCVYKYLSMCVYIELVSLLKLFSVFLDLRFHFQVLISLYRSLLR